MPCLGYFLIVFQKDHRLCNAFFIGVSYSTSATNICCANDISLIDCVKLHLAIKSAHNPIILLVVQIWLGHGSYLRGNQNWCI